jgi:tRNA(adenine34) deaminase
VASCHCRCYNGSIVTESHFKNVNDESLMRLALEQAKLAAARGEAPVGAVAVLDGEIIASAHNRKETDGDPTAHAELLALRQAAKFLGNWRLIDVTLYSTLEPCPMCAGAMIQARLSRLVYGAPDLRFGADGSVVDIMAAPGFNHQVAITSGVLEEESAALLQRFFRELRVASRG